MKIFYDLTAVQPSSGSKFHGGGMYADIVFRRLLEKTTDVVAYYDSRAYISDDILSLCREKGVDLIDIAQTTPKEAYEKTSCDRAYSALPHRAFMSINSSRLICTIHGLRDLELKFDCVALRYKHGSMRDYARNIASRVLRGYIFRHRQREWRRIMAGDVVVVSQHTANALNVWFEEASSRKFPVFYSPSTVREIAMPEEKIDGNPYILMVSGNRWEKNVLRSIMAIEKLFDKGLLKGINVNITGLTSYKQLRYHFRHPERFNLLGYVSESDLSRLYRDAYMFVYPSVNEGFGYPPLEAMHCGIPVAASAVASIPEVCGDAVLYFNPFDEAEIANRILQLTDDDTRQRLIESGYNRYNKIKERQDRDLDALVDYICRD